MAKCAEAKVVGIGGSKIRRDIRLTGNTDHTYRSQHPPFSDMVSTKSGHNDLWLAESIALFISFV